MPVIDTMIEEKKPRAPRKTAKKTIATDLKDMILKSLDEDKAEDILYIDLRGKSSLADDMIIASGRSGRHVAALADKIIGKLKDNGVGKAKVEGLTNSDWVLIDAGDIVVHLFRPEVREFYAIERIWAEPKTVLAGKKS